MAYRVPRDPRVKQSARYQNRLARMAGLVVLWILVALLVPLADRTIARQHLPWKPLAVVDPVGLATRVKTEHVGDDPAACRVLLRKAGVRYVDLPEKTEGEFCTQHGALRLDGGLAPLSPADAPMVCKEALALSIWERQVVQPAAQAVLGQGVVGLDQFGTYSCRRIYGQAQGAVSEHASANALDVGGFTLADGQTVQVARDWNDPGPKGQFLHRVRDGACKVFVTTLSPDYNAAHHNHFHLDMGGWTKCA